MAAGARVLDQALVVFQQVVAHRVRPRADHDGVQCGERRGVGEGGRVEHFDLGAQSDSIPAGTSSPTPIT